MSGRVFHPEYIPPGSRRPQVRSNDDAPAPPRDRRGRRHQLGHLVAEEVRDLAEEALGPYLGGRVSKILGQVLSALVAPGEATKPRRITQKAVKAATSSRAPKGGLRR
jgi:hypothetical protein